MNAAKERVKAWVYNSVIKESIIYDLRPDTKRSYGVLIRTETPSRNHIFRRQIKVFIASKTTIENLINSNESNILCVCIAYIYIYIYNISRRIMTERERGIPKSFVFFRLTSSARFQKLEIIIGARKAPQAEKLVLRLCLLL